jgi:aspartate racemase
MNKKKKLGIVGGMGSRAGMLLLKKIIDYSPAITDQEFLEIIFHNNSNVPDRTRAIVNNEESPLNEIQKSLELFNSNHVEVVALACITAYYFYDQIKAASGAFVMNPLQLAAEYISKNFAQAKRIGVLATTGTLRSGLFHKALDPIGVEVIHLNALNQEQLFMRSVYMKNGFKSAFISEEAKYLMNRSVEKLLEQDVDVMIGGCTETTVGIDPAFVPVPFIDLTDLLAQNTVHYCYNNSNSKYIKDQMYG